MIFILYSYKYSSKPSTIVTSFLNSDQFFLPRSTNLLFGLVGPEYNPVLESKPKPVLIYIYIYEMGSSYIWCNSYKITHFLHRKFLKDLTVKNKQLNIYYFSYNLPENYQILREYHKYILPPSHMNCGFYHKFNQQDPQLCEMEEYALMVLQEYPTITLICLINNIFFLWDPASSISKVSNG